VLAGPLAAQRVVRRTIPTFDRVPPVMQTVTVDLAQAAQEHYGIAVEPLVFGRFSLGLSGEYTTARDGEWYPPPVVYEDCPLDRLCSSYAAPPEGGQSREWSFAIHGRWYPAMLTRSTARQSIAAYVGEFVGYRQRRVTDVNYYPCAACALPADSGSYPPSYPPTYPPTYPPYGNTVTTTISAWEPGAEAGVRIVAARHLVIDVGATARLVRLDDYRSSVRRGDVDSNLKVAIGIGW
jgi:hypothetical protein